MTTQPTRVLFVHTPSFAVGDRGEPLPATHAVTAIFVDTGRPASYVGADTRNAFAWFYECYARVGQHTSCHRAWAQLQPTATPAQYAELLAELGAVGYDVVVVDALPVFGGSHV